MTNTVLSILNIKPLSPPPISLFNWINTWLHASFEHGIRFYIIDYVKGIHPCVLVVAYFEIEPLRCNALGIDVSLQS